MESLVDVLLDHIPTRLEKLLGERKLKGRKVKISWVDVMKVQRILVATSITDDDAEEIEGRLRHGGMIRDERIDMVD